MCCDSTYLNRQRQEAAMRHAQPERGGRVCRCGCLMVRALTRTPGDEGARTLALADPRVAVPLAD